MKITQTIDKDRILVRCPYTARWRTKADGLGGWYVGSQDEWSLPICAAEEVDRLLTDIYGCDGKTEVDRVDVEYILQDSSYGQEVPACGLVLARRWHRDQRVTLSAGVWLKEGGFGRHGGSTKYPAIGAVEPGTTLLIRDVPIALAEKFVRRKPGMTIVDGVRSEK